MDRNFNSATLVKKEKPAETENNLPWSYGRTEAFLLPKDPAQVFLLWDITGATYDYIKSQHGLDIFDKSRSVARLHDVTDINFNGFNSHVFYDLPLVLDGKSWYLNVPESGRNYVADLGLIDHNGHFILIARSNMAIVPPGKVSSKTDEKWMTVDVDFEKLLLMSGAQFIGMGASERSVMLSEKWSTVLGPDFKGVPSSYLSSNMSSRAVIASESKNIDDDLWLRADCEIIIHGAASEGAKLTVNGEEIISENNTFYIRQSFPAKDKLELDIKAEKNGKDKKIKIEAERRD